MFKKALTTKIASLGLVVLAIILGQSKYWQWRNQKAIEANIAVLKQQEAERQQKIDDLNQSISYLNSNDFKEKVAREQLGFKRSGENVYGFSEPTNAVQPVAATLQVKTNNTSAWWNYFFGNQ